jgi:hypothetical protein
MSSLDRLHVVAPRSVNSVEVMLKSFIQTLMMYNAVEIVVLTNQGTKVMLVSLILQ